MGPWPWIIGGSIVALALLGAGASSSAAPPFRVVPGRLQGDAFPPLGSFPVRITSPFAWRADPKTGERKHHQGLDLSAPIGTPVFAPVDGVVAKVLGNHPVMGNAVCIRARGYRWWFIHLAASVVAPGMSVARGQPIGYSGSTGRSTGPHLHITIEDETQGGAKVDPQQVYPRSAFSAAPAVSGADVGAFGDVALVESEEDNIAREHRRMDAETNAIMQTYDLPEEYARAIVEAADWVGGSGVHLARVIWAESRMKTRAVNPSTGASGLIQFMPSTAKKLGTTVEAIRRMGFLDQMQLVGDYLERVALGQWAGGEEGLLDTQFKMAAAVFYPAWRNRDPNTVLPAAVQKVNPGIRTMGSYLNFVLAAKTPLDRKLQAAGVGSLTGDKNPCNWMIEADRRDRRLEDPDRDMLLTYRDVPESPIQAECADTVIRRAKKAGRKPADDQAQLRAGVRSWYARTPGAPGAPAAGQRGSVTFTSSRSAPRFG